MHKYNSQGFSLIELLITVTILTLVVSLSLPAYQYQISQAHLESARTALLKNAQFLEQYYRQHGSYKATSTTWPSLPIPQTDHFCIRMQGTAKGALDHKFMLKAVALNPEADTRTIKLDDDGNFFLCETTASSCQDNSPFFNNSNNTDQNCTAYLTH